jgi:fumarate hydratase class II
MASRTETDSLGAVEIADEHLWGAQTQRSLGNFPIGGERMPDGVIRALVLVKKAAARENAKRGALDARLADAIVQAADEILAGQWSDQFPLVIWQTGSGTQTNMNVNEVLANRASELLGGRRGDKHHVHPNDHVNLAQSSNDVFPTAMNMSAVAALEDRLLPELRALAQAFEAKAAAWSDIIKLGRTHLMDATPMTLGNEASGWAAQLRAAASAIEQALERLRPLAIGGTAVGTGLSAPAGWGATMAAALSTLAGRRFTSAPNKFAALSSHDDFVLASGALNSLAAALLKIGNDVRWLASGPRAGLGELELPANEPGSSIMPGKVNPTQIEALAMVCVWVMGIHVALSFAGAQGQLQLSTYKPVIIHGFLQSVRLLSDACASFRSRCVEGIEPNRGRIHEHVQQSLMLVTALVPALGYDQAARVARTAHERGLSLREAAVTLGVLTAEAFDTIVDPKRMLGS